MNVAPDASQFHYSVMAAALRYIDERRGTRPSLDEIAGAAGLGAAQFRRAFSQWVGVDTNDCLAHLLPDHARRLLDDRFTALGTAGGADRPALRWEAMAPDELARRGKGLTIGWGWFDSPFGEVLAMGTERGLCGMAFAAELGRDRTLADMRGRWPAASVVIASRKSLSSRVLAFARD